jgi:phenylpropionate dioxygenase-like ring-hydroxylating dioxygenase large terminal subunit|tara:strand:- start:206 stop:454 length:249 start_codon:yes stop_codon:yes gene_type:complete
MDRVQSCPTFAPQAVALQLEVEADTPTSEMRRRYWHRFGVADDATGTPKQVRILDEDLILFRDGNGQPRLVHLRCCHRGTML